MFPGGTGVWEYTVTLKMVAIKNNNLVFMVSFVF
jgi:hypothetical protein